MHCGCYSAALSLFAGKQRFLRTFYTVPGMIPGRGWLREREGDTSLAEEGAQLRVGTKGLSPPPPPLSQAGGSSRGRLPSNNGVNGTRRSGLARCPWRPFTRCPARQLAWEGRGLCYMLHPCHMGVCVCVCVWGVVISMGTLLHLESANSS